MTSTEAPQPYRHPGRAFAEQYGPPRTGEDVLRYADFLRREAHVGDEPPIDLSRVFARFGMPAPRRASLPDVQGLLLDSEAGVIAINQDDPESRQRFTQAHELMELLFDAQEDVAGWAGPKQLFEGQTKERLCEEGAAALLMPQSSFLPRVTALGVALGTASELAELYRTSLLAACLQMARYGPGAHALVVWHDALKPVQIRDLPSSAQLPLLAPELIPSPQKTLRVWWATWTQGLQNGLVPKHKSIPRDSLIIDVFNTGLSRSDVEQVNLGQLRGTCLIEARRVTVGEECCVLSLLHLPSDTACRARHQQGPDQH